MARSLEKIQQYLTAIEKKVSQLSLEIHRVYRQYLGLLGHSVKRQLITAVYRICTHAYPESFLRLSLDEQAQLQARFKQLGKDVEEHLLSYVERPPDSENYEVEKIANPEDLMKWCQCLEKGINETLDILSHKANRSLQQFQILPSKLPSKILEIALRSDGEETAISNLPNLLDLLVDSPENEESSNSEEDTKITKITAIHLRLSEIEFADPTVGAARNQIRHLLEQLSKMGQQYHQIKRDYTAVRAEEAWRMSWVEE